MIACDLGSNTFRVVQIDCETKERIKEFEKIVKTAEGVDRTGIICDAAVKRVIAAILEAKKIFDFDLEGYVAVATAALRLAKNAQKVIDQIYEKTNIRFKVIDGKEEAEYTRIGVENRLQKSGLSDSSYVLLDLGGGSCEVILKDNSVTHSRSFDVGIVTMVEKYGLSDIDRGIIERCEPIKIYAQNLADKPAYFIGASGTPTTIASFLQGMDYAHYDFRKVNGFRLSVDDMKKALDGLLALDIEQRVRWVGVGRDDLIIAGVKILIYIVMLFGFKELVVVDDGLREGVGLSYCK